MGILGKVASVFTGGTMSEDEIESMVPGLGDAQAQERANKANVAEAALNRQFQERMSSTAYQRAMEDMKKAGLNPTLAYMQGGASAPSGGAAQVQPAAKTGLGDFALRSLTGIGSLKQQATALEQQQAMNESTVQLNKSTAAKNLQEAESTRIRNVKDAKYEPAHDITGRVVRRASKEALAYFDSSVKDARESQNKFTKAMKNASSAMKTKPQQKSFLDGIKQIFNKGQ